jgi:hypothetical protein
VCIGGNVFQNSKKKGSRSRFGGCSGRAAGKETVVVAGGRATGEEMVVVAGEKVDVVVGGRSSSSPSWIRMGRRIWGSRGRR